jgi:hypothetical protein
MVEHNSIKMKKTFAILLAVCFLMSVAAATVSAAPGQIKFTPGRPLPQLCTPNSSLYKQGYAAGYEDGFATGHAECMHTPMHKKARSNSTGCWEIGFNAGFPIGYQAGLHSCKPIEIGHLSKLELIKK